MENSGKKFSFPSESKANKYITGSMYHEMTRYITVASTIIDDPKTAAAEIDRVLNGSFNPYQFFKNSTLIVE